jgi:hypothetical protein
MTPPRQPVFVSEEMQRRRAETQAAIRELLADPGLPPQLRRILTADPEELTEAELKARITLVFHQRKKRAEQANSRQSPAQPTYPPPNREPLAMQAEARKQQRQPPLVNHSDVDVEDRQIAEHSQGGD